MIESTTYMARMMFNDIKQYFDKEDLERFENDFKNLELLFEEQMKQAYYQGHNDRWHVNRSDIPQAFNDYFKTYKL
ncbi:hypothetical protein UFOVP603_34 [uncultured Caudovirales phage]|uniref:Uncharacterized protein n=1 Tax=uncultured Caudovirales phage TaxID=2100421 RepID=A0A6J5N3H5_9CAUD|nr:hypothetical protein UFOVP603_34 [uncultured Caudovirales phage]